MSALLAHPLLSQSVLADHHWDGPGWWIVFPILWFLFVVTIVTVFVLNARRWRGRWGSQSGVARLAERFASGEIDETEYRQRLSVLKERR
jgi:putative membrane protein